MTIFSNFYPQNRMQFQVLTTVLTTKFSQDVDLVTHHVMSLTGSALMFVILVTFANALMDMSGIMMVNVFLGNIVALLNVIMDGRKITNKCWYRSEILIIFVKHKKTEYLLTRYKNIDVKGRIFWIIERANKEIFVWKLYFL